jgi:predicted transposase YbfD/YdcC
MRTTRIIDFFDDLTDVRSPYRNKQHELIDIVAISICAVICGADSWEEIEEYAKVKEEWLTTFLNLPNGIPSHDTINRVMSSICPIEFENCFKNWVKSLIIATNEDIISIDGKTIRGAKINGKSPIHMVSAWSSLNNIVLGQVKVDEKSNEITAIPMLIENLAIEGAVITIDAMGCQSTITELIIERKSNYVLSLKENQSSLLEQVKDEFLFSKSEVKIEDIDYGHGRIETRTCSVISDFKHLTNYEKWKNLTSIIKVESVREFKNKEKIETSTRFYVSSLKYKPAQFQDIIRNHWAIENKLHWTLDVAFGEDYDRKRSENAAQNFSLINKIVLNLVKNETTCKLGIKSKRKIAGWDENYLLKILGF